MGKTQKPVGVTTTLYKKNSNNRLQIWQITTHQGKFLTTEGLIDGKLTTSAWTYCEGKNIGRSNETTPHEQAIREAAAKVTKKLEQGYYYSQEDAGRGKQFIEPMLAHKYSTFKALPGEHLSQPKLDGIRNICDGITNKSRKGKEFVCLPHLLDPAKALIKRIEEISNVTVIALDGEAYNHRLKDDFNAITSLVKKTKPTPNDLSLAKELMEYCIYDIITEEELTNKERAAILRKAFKSKKFPHLVRVPTKTIHTEEQLNNLYLEYLSNGYEGQMLRLSSAIYHRGRTKSLLKRKETLDDECKVIGITEGIGNASGLAASATCIHPNGQQFDANIMGPASFRAELLRRRESFIGKMATIKYQNLTPGGKPRFPRLLTFRDYE